MAGDHNLVSRASGNLGIIMTFYSLLNNSKLDIKSNMPKKYERKIHQLWTEETMTKAIDEVTSRFTCNCQEIWNGRIGKSIRYFMY